MNTVFSEGQVLNGRYELVEQLGEGGFGVVFKAYDNKLCRHVAVKTLSPTVLRNALHRDDMVQRLWREIRILSKLDPPHPHIVRLLDYHPRLKSSRSPPEWVVMSYADGQNLQTLLESEGPLSADTALSIMRQVLDALTFMHAHGIVHRDLKPANIVIDRAGLVPHAYLLDFGLSAITEALRSNSYEAATTDGNVPMTPSYVAPEQLKQQLTPMSDLYAWGLVLAECLSGQRVVQYPSIAQVIHAHLDPAPHVLPAPLVGHPAAPIISFAIAKKTDPKDNHFAGPLRAPSAAALLEALDLAFPSLPCPPLSTPTVTERQPSPHPVRMRVMRSLAALTALVAFIIIFALSLKGC